MNWEEIKALKIPPPVVIKEGTWYNRARRRQVRANRGNTLFKNKSPKAYRTPHPTEADNEA